MKELVKVYQDRGNQFIEDLFNDYVVITEKLSGSAFSFQKTGPTLSFYKGDNQRPINLIDRTLMVYYEPPIKYISSLPKEVLQDVPDNWRFSFQYFVHNNPGVITYDKLPKNSLVLTHIIVKDDRGKNAKIIEDPRIIKDWALKLGVTPMQPIFQGHLDKGQKDKLIKFIEIPVEDQMELFGTTSFVEYIVKSLNPNINSTILNTDLSKPIDSIIFKFYKPGSTQTYTAKMVDPYTRSLMKEREPVDIRRAPADINEIVLLDILAFLEERGLKKHEVLSQYPQERYLELVSGLFNDYVSKRGGDLAKLDFQKADFAKAKEFDLNTDLIRNEKTKELILGSEALKDLFKVMLGSLRKKRHPKKEGPLFTQSVITDFNNMVDKIKDITKEEGDGKFKTFEDYLNLKNINEEVYIKEDLLDLMFEERYLNFSDFVNLEKFAIHEALKVPHKNHGKKKVNLFVGRFQPFTKGHIKVLEDLHRQNKHPVMVMIVRGKKTDPKRAPFDEESQQRMVAALQSEFPFIEGSVVVPNGAIDTMFSSLRPAYEPVLWGYGTDRKKSYDSQIRNDSYRAQLGVLPEFSGHEIKRGDEDVSASKVRKALEIDDQGDYEKLVPRSLHDFYDELQNVMMPVEEALVVEASTTYTNLWQDKFKEWPENSFKGSETDNVRGGVGDEVLRANWGKDGPIAQANIEKFLNDQLGLSKGDYDIREWHKKIVPTGQDSQVSGSLNSYEIKFKKAVTLLGKTFGIGDQVFITNRGKTSTSGQSQIILGKDLTPDALGIAPPGKTYKDGTALWAVVQPAIKGLNYPQAYEDFIIKSTEAVMQDRSNAGSETNFQKYAESGSPITYDMPDALFKDIDENSINSFQNDYGEILGGFMLFNILKVYGTALSYPVDSNNAVADFHFDGYDVSSKGVSPGSGKKGGTPSGSTYIHEIYEKQTKGDEEKWGNPISPNKAQKDFYDTVVLNWVKAQKGKKYGGTGIYNVGMTLAPIVIPKTAKGYWSLFSGKPPYIPPNKMGFPADPQFADVLAYADSMASDKKAWADFWIKFTKETGYGRGTQTPAKAEKKRLQFLREKKTGRIGVIYYPIMKQLVKFLNEKYKGALSSFLQAMYNSKQVYLTVDVKKPSGEFEFLTKQFSNAQYEFEAKGDTMNPFMSHTGIKML